MTAANARCEQATQVNGIESSVCELIFLHREQVVLPGMVIGLGERNQLVALDMSQLVCLGLEGAKTSGRGLQTW